MSSHDEDPGLIVGEDDVRQSLLAQDVLRTAEESRSGQEDYAVALEGVVESEHANPDQAENSRANNFHDVECDAEANGHNSFKALVWREEVGLICFLAVGIFLSRASWVIIKTTDTALLGHVSPHALSASAIADLFMSATRVLTGGGVLGIFVGQSVGANDFHMASVWLQISLVALTPLAIIVMILWFLTGPVLTLLGADKELIPDAAYYGSVLALSVPGRLIMTQISQFLSAHGRVRPEANVFVFACVCNLVLGLVFVLGVPFKGWEGFGFKACPWVTVSTETVQVFVFWFIYAYWFSLHRELGWTGWHFEEITRERVKEFLKLYIPAMLSSCSDYWRMSVIGILAATLGNIELGVFNASYRIFWMSLTIVGSLAFAVRVRLSNYLGAGNIHAAKMTVHIGMVIAAVSLSSIALVICFAIQDVAKIFSNDPEILGLFEGAAVPIALTLVLMNLAVFLEQIPLAMGKTRATFMAGVVGSWLGQVPGAYIAITYWRHDFNGLYYGVAVGYGILCLLLIVIISCTDWDAVVKDAQRRNAL